MTEPGYWDGTVLCPRKGLSHINHKMCSDLYDVTECGPCGNRDEILQIQAQESVDEMQLKAERRALSSGRKRKKDK